MAPPPTAEAGDSRSAGPSGGCMPIQDHTEVFEARGKRGVFFPPDFLMEPGEFPGSLWR